MAKKRRKPRPRAPQAPASRGGTGREPGEVKAVGTKPTQTPTHHRAERKEQARAARDEARRRLERQRRIRRATTLAGVVAVVSVVVYLVFRTTAPGLVPEETLALARAAGCGDVQVPTGSAPGGDHLAAGETATYTERPASFGPHETAPLPSSPVVFTQPIREENAVHNLEHGYVILYYRAEGPEALPEDVLSSLSQIAESQDKVFVAPYPELDEGTSLAMVAWNKVWECPSTLEAADAATLAGAFIEAYRGTSNAPEGNVPA